MNSPQNAISKLNSKVGKDGRLAFFVTFITGILCHMSALTFDVPNHDGLASMYFDQNMITSGRWFLGVACGISTFFSLPWLIGFLAILYLSITSVFLTKLLKITTPIMIAISGMMLVTFPSLASNFAYAFTMDGYMLGVLFAVLSVYFVERGKFGFIIGAVFLSLSMGTYQAYLPMAILLCLYKVLELLMDKEAKNKVRICLRYVYMGVCGGTLYFIILKLMLFLQGKVLDTYQGIDSLSSGQGINLIATLKTMYFDFVSFSLQGKILFSNPISLIAVILLLIAFVVSFVIRIVKNKLYKSVWTYIAVFFVLLLIPLCTNAILLISKDVTYHLLMRYQWVIFGIVAIAFIDNTFLKYPSESGNIFLWVTILSSIVIIFSYVCVDNIAYGNLSKKYEKTYAYCLRLADRIEQTEGYYEGIPIYMIGVVGDESYPVTDITGNVTDHMLGISGDYLLYTPANYDAFYRNYLGITFNFLMPDEANFYDSKEYVDMHSFPAKDSTKVVDGILFVKTENMH